MWFRRVRQTYPLSLHVRTSTYVELTDQYVVVYYEDTNTEYLGVLFWDSYTSRNTSFS
jgi:hypothetical protein